MSASVHEQADDRGIELGSEVNWRLIIATAGLGLVVLSGVVVLALLPQTPAAPRKDTALALRATVPAREPVSQLLPRPEPRTKPPETPSRPEPVVATKPAAPEMPTAQTQPPPAPVVPKLVPAPASVVAAAPAPADAAPVAPVPSFKRRQHYNEEALRAKLSVEARDLDIEAEKGTSEKLLSEAKKTAPPRRIEKASADKDAPKPSSEPQAILELIARRDDLKGLPVRNVDECQAPAKEAQTMQKLSLNVRDLSRVRGRQEPDSSFSAILQREAKLVGYLLKMITGNEWRDEVGVRMLLQMFQPEGLAVRGQVVKMLASNKTKSGSAALAQWAVFDLHPEIREAAVKALKDRPSAEYRSVLLDALRYPWPPVADHAAEALVALGDRDAAVDLVRLLEQPDPRAPAQDREKKWRVPELVRVNHLGNCLLCHAPSLTERDAVRGLIPERGKSLPVVYYESSDGNFVRADVTYLRQDFSLMQTVAEPDKWPRWQRFDYLIRQRELSKEEVSRLPATEKATTYPQREAALWALRELTGQDAGTRCEDWKSLLRKERLARDP
jgi:hypothetical protein